jgi:cation:H+ antiporter
MNAWLALALGLALLIAGAEVLIRGGAALALRLGLSALVVGLTVMAYGTSSPELVVSVQAATSGNSAISLGNVIGSNICNVLLILGLASLITPVSANAQVIRREVPIMIGATFLIAVMLLDGELGRIDGAILVSGVVLYTFLTVRDSRRQAAAHPEPESESGDGKKLGLGLAILYVVVGLGILVAGSDLFVNGAVQLASGWGVSQAVIGLTIVAIGTSLPELATSVVAALKNSADVAVGNVVGSNIFNILGILGTAALVQPMPTGDISKVDLGVMIAAAILFLPVIRLRGKVGRIEGATMLISYAAYTLWLVNQQG